MALFIAVGPSADVTTGLLAGRPGNAVRRRPLVQRRLHGLSGTVSSGLAVRLAVDTR